MADLPPYPGLPRWMKISGIIAIVLALLVAVIVFTGIGGPHGPGRHMSSGDPGGHTPPAEHVMQPGTPTSFVSGTPGTPLASGNIPPEADPVRARFAAYTVEQAAQEGYVRDEFCLDAAAFGQPVEHGAMGFHATNEKLLRGPIDSNRPQALMFDAHGRVLGVEYEVTTDAVSEAPRLFGQTFGKLPAHAGVEHEHYALHLWFVENPSGALADFNPSVSCPPGSTPQHEPGEDGH